MDVVVRRAIVPDAVAVARVHSRSWRAAYRGLLPERYLARLEPAALVPRWRRTIAGGLPPQQVAVAERAGGVVGFVAFGMLLDPSWEGHAGEVSWLYVDPDATGRGVGTQLLEHALAALEHGGLRWARVRVLAENARARRFYERAGLRLDGPASREVVGGARVGVVAYARALAPVVDWDAIFAPDAGATRR